MNAPIEESNAGLVRFIRVACVLSTLKLSDTFIRENVMTTEGGYVCKPCGKVIKYRGSLVRHVVDQHVNLGVKYQCPICKMVAGTKNSLQTHVSRNHPELKGLDYGQCVLRGEY